MFRNGAFILLFLLAVSQPTQATQIAVEPALRKKDGGTPALQFCAGQRAVLPLFVYATPETKLAVFARMYLRADPLALPVSQLVEVPYTPTAAGSIRHTGYLEFIVPAVERTSVVDIEFIARGTGSQAIEKAGNLQFTVHPQIFVEEKNNEERMEDNSNWTACCGCDVAADALFCPRGN